MIKESLFGNNRFPEFFHSPSLLLTQIMSEHFFIDYFLKTRNNFQSFLEKKTKKKYDLSYRASIFHRPLSYNGFV